MNKVISLSNLSVIKSARISDLMSFGTLLILTICLLEDNINLEILSLPIGIITCLLDSPLVVMLRWGFSFLDLLIVLWIALIFFKKSLENMFLILRTFLILADNAYVYNFLFLLLFFSISFVPLLWWYFNSAILNSKITILALLIAKNLLNLKRKINWAWPFYKLGIPGWLSLY